MAKEELQNPASSKSSGSKKIIAFAGVGVLVAGIVVAVAVFLAGGSSPNEAAAAERSEQAVAEQNRPALYFSLFPAFIVNFRGKESRARFLKIELEGVTREAHVVEAIKAHMPMIRNNLLLLFRRPRDLVNISHLSCEIFHNLNLEH